MSRTITFIDASGASFCALEGCAPAGSAARITWLRKEEEMVEETNDPRSHGTAMSGDEVATTILSERTTEERLNADVDCLLHAIDEVLKNNAIEVWQSYRQICLG